MAVLQHNLFVEIATIGFINVKISPFSGVWMFPFLSYLHGITDLCISYSLTHSLTHSNDRDDRKDIRLMFFYDDIFAKYIPMEADLYYQARAINDKLALPLQMQHI